MPFAVSVFSPLELGVLVVWSLAIVSPTSMYAARTRTSIAMGITVSVLLGAVVQVLWSMLYGWEPWSIGSGPISCWSPLGRLNPGSSTPLATAGFLHGQGDMMRFGATSSSSLWWASP